MLCIPNPFRTSNRSRFTAFEALCILCSRFAYPNRLWDLEFKTGRRSEQISHCVNNLSSFLYGKWGFLLKINPVFLTPARLETYASAIHAAGAPTTTEVAGFIDCNIKIISRPGVDQRALYSGYAGAHALKFQGVAAPDGLAIQFYGPVEGRRADGGVLTLSGLNKTWREYGRGYGGRQMLLYGDPAYGETEIIMSGRKEPGRLPQIEQELNILMAKYRECIEWTFGKVQSNWRMFEMVDQMRLNQSPIGRHYLLAALLTNAHTCLHGSQTSRYFNLAPPKLQEYFRKH